MSKISEQKILKMTKNIEAFGLTKTFNWMKESIEQKALETYPEIEGSETYFDRDYICTKPIDLNKQRRQGYIKGYDQAFQNFMEKAEEFFYEQFNIHPHDCHVVQYVSDTPIEDIDDFVEQFKNYMEDESK